VLRKVESQDPNSKRGAAVFEEVKEELGKIKEDLARIRGYL